MLCVVKKSCLSETGLLSTQNIYLKNMENSWINADLFSFFFVSVTKHVLDNFKLQTGYNIHIC